MYWKEQDSSMPAIKLYLQLWTMIVQYVLDCKFINTSWIFIMELFNTHANKSLMIWIFFLKNYVYRKLWKYGHF